MKSEEKLIETFDNEELNVLNFFDTLKLYSIGLKPLKNTNFVYICTHKGEEEFWNGKLIHENDLKQIESKFTILHTFDANIIDLIKKEITC